MNDTGLDPELQRLTDAHRAVSMAIRALNLAPETEGTLYRTLLEYQIQAVRYRLADLDRVTELRRQLETTYYKHLQAAWFAELNQDELLEVLPTLIEASLDWDPNGKGDLMRVAYEALDTLPRAQAQTIYLNAFTAYLRRWARSVRRPQDVPETARAALNMVAEYVYATRTGQENIDTLQAVVLTELGSDALPLYLAHQAGIRELLED